MSAMRKDHNGAKFNENTRAAGANMGQASNEARELKRNVARNLPFLMVRGAPTDFTETSLENLCSSFARVYGVNRHKDTFFVRLPTTGDMEKVQHALEQSNYGLRIIVGDRNRQKNKPPGSAADPVVHKNLYIKGSAQSQVTSEHNSIHRGSLNQQIAKKDHGEFQSHTGQMTKGKAVDFVKETNSHSSSMFNREIGAYVKSLSDRVNVKKCASCGFLTAQKCGRCNEPYCSVACQRAAWPQHRYVCGIPSFLKATIPTEPTPAGAESVTASKANDITDVTSNMPRNSTLVKITFVSAPNFVFIRSNKYYDREDFAKMMSEIQEHGNECNSLLNAPSSGKLVLTKYKGLYNRAVVLKAESDNKFKVDLVDYGNTEYRQLGELFEAPQSYRLLARQSTPVYLKGVPNCNMAEQTRDFMYSQTEKIDFRVYYSASDLLSNTEIYNVELFYARTMQSFNQAIMEIGHPKPAADFYFYDEIPQNLPSEGENITFVVMSNSFLEAGFITCALLEHFEEIEKIQAQLQRYVESVEGKEYTPRINEVCIGQYRMDGKWYRGKCLELDADGFPAVQFIDSGNLDFVSVKNIRRYPTEFSFPLYTVKCKIEGLPDYCGKDLVEELEKHLTARATITCDKAEFNKEGNYFSLTLNAVLEALQAKGHLDE